MSFIHESHIDVRVSEQDNKFSHFVRSLPSVSCGTVSLNWFLSWPHLSTVYTALANFEKVDHVYYKRFILEHRDAGNNTLDLAVRTHVALSEEEYEASGSTRLPPRTRHMSKADLSSFGSSTPGVLVVLVHGLAGGSHESYIRHTVTAIHTRFKDDESVTVVAFNARGCARSTVTSKQYWNAAQTDDLSAALQHLSDIYPNRKIMAIGYSLGANILCNYLAKTGSASRVTLAVSVSNPWNLLASNRTLESYALGRLYSKRMAAGLQRLYKRNSAFLSLHQDIDEPRIMSATSLHDFDAAFTVRAFGYASTEEYYTVASSSRTVADIETNTIILNAKDDPMALDAVLPYAQVKQNPHLCLLATGHGGHIGWYGLHGDRWFSNVIVESLAGLLHGDL